MSDWLSGVHSTWKRPKTSIRYNRCQPLKSRQRRLAWGVKNCKRSDDAVVYARPDDLSANGMSWRDVLLKYNEENRNNPLGLLPAYQLYENPSSGSC